MCICVVRLMVVFGVCVYVCCTVDGGFWVCVYVLYS